MSKQFIHLTLADWHAEFPQFVEGPVKQTEVTLEHPVGDVEGLVVRVYTSIRNESGGASACGADAIRVFAIDKVLEEAGAQPVIVNPHTKGKSHIKRTKSWASNTREMAREVWKTALARVDWMHRRRVEAGVEVDPAKAKKEAEYKAKDEMFKNGVAVILCSWCDATYTFPTKKARRDTVRKLIRENVHAAVAALAIVWSGQTEDEKASETTVELNGIGFTGRDGEFGTSLGNQWKEKGFLSPKQLGFVQKMMPKYADQIIRYFESQGCMQIVKPAKAKPESYGVDPAAETVIAEPACWEPTEIIVEGEQAD